MYNQRIVFITEDLSFPIDEGMKNSTMHLSTSLKIIFRISNFMQVRQIIN